MSSPPTRLDQLLEIEGVDTVVDRVLGTFVRYLSFRGIPLAYQLDRGLGGTLGSGKSTPFLTWTSVGQL